jgi:hypothetical protein
MLSKNYVFFSRLLVFVVKIIWARLQPQNSELELCSILPQNKKNCQASERLNGVTPQPC